MSQVIYEQILLSYPATTKDRDYFVYTKIKIKEEEAIAQNYDLMVREALTRD